MALDLSTETTQILNELGQFGYVKLVQKTRTYDPASGVQTSVETVVDLSAVDLPVPDTLVDGERILKTDKYIIMDGATEPTGEDLIRVNDKDYTIVEITPTNHAGVPQVYEVVARG